MASSSRYALAPLVTGSSWLNVYSAIHYRAFAARQRDAGAADGTTVPRLTNREAVALIMAWRTVAAMLPQRWPLWYQYAAAAYGWDPSSDRLDASAGQGGRIYPVSASEPLWDELRSIATGLDRQSGAEPYLSLEPSVDIDSDAFASPIVQGEVMSALREDGAEALFRIPLPACEDKDGRPTRPRRNPNTGKWECKPLTVDDPLTHGRKQASKFGGLLLIVGALWLLTGAKSSGKRRGRKK